MKKFNPVMEVVRFSSEDVIATSGAKSLTWSNLGNNDPSDNTISFNGNSYNQGNSDSAAVKNALDAYFNCTEDYFHPYGTNIYASFTYLFGSATGRDELDGEYVYGTNKWGEYYYIKQ